MATNYSLYVGISCKTFARNLTKLMAEADLTAKDIQQMLDLESVQAVYYWMEGERFPKAKQMFGLAHILNVSVEELVSPVFKEQELPNTDGFTHFVFDRKPFSSLDSKDVDPEILKYLYERHFSYGRY